MGKKLKRIVLEDPMYRNLELVEFLMKGFTEEEKVHPIAEANWKWRYCDVPAGHAVISIVIDEAANDLIVGSSVTVPALCTDGKEGFKGGIGGAGYVHPDYRRIGIYSMLRSAEVEAVKARNVAVMVGLANESATAVSVKKAKYRLHQYFEVALRELCFLGLHAYRRPRKLAKHAALYFLGEMTRDRQPDVPVRVERLERFGEESNALWQRVRNDDYLGLVKDAEYLNWRYVARPNSSFIAFMGWHQDEPRALCVIEWFKHPSHAWVAELLMRNEDADMALAVLRHSMRRAAKVGVNDLDALVDGTSLGGGVVNRAGFTRLSARPFMLKLIDGQSRDSFAGPWRYSMGDYMAGAQLWSPAK